MPPEETEIRNWLRKAYHDWSVARNIVAAQGPENDVAAFHCQQAIEKMLKAYLVSCRIPFEKAHDLGRLLDHCASQDSSFETLRDKVEPLTLYAVAFRYPGPADPTRQDVESALQVVQQLWDFLGSRLPVDVQPPESD
ncbi:MAG: HEPN domain-containing protein [Planctomycetota bacterium]|jgi:HEPN domain-containing protein